MLQGLFLAFVFMDRDGKLLLALVFMDRDGKLKSLPSRFELSAIEG